VAGYLNAHRIVNLAVATGCDALHPATDFCPKTRNWPRSVRRGHHPFIGPNAEVIRRMGDKTEARRSPCRPPGAR
jgi:pyruvate carboxylase subunit A